MDSTKSLDVGFHRERFPLGESRETTLKEVCPEAFKQFPHYYRLQHDPVSLLKWRKYARQRAKDDLKFRGAVWEACRQDFLFFCVTFVWIFEPRPLPRRLPFHPFTSQITLAAWICECFGVRSAAVNKTRGIGLSWLVSAFILWKWLFVPEVAIALLTEDERKLDAAEGSNSSFGKLQYIYDHMPSWVRAKNALKRSLGEHTFVNMNKKGLVEGYVATGTKLRQLRFTWLFADEFAFYPKHSQDEWMTSSSGTVASRLFGSTWNDYDDMFHRIMYEEESAMLRISAFWWNDYERWKGAYKMQAGQMIPIDTEFHHEPDYQFGTPGWLEEGIIRSPWVDGELLEPGVDVRKTLRDLYGMTVAERTNSFFNGEIRMAVRKSLQQPTLEGILHVRAGKVEIQPTKKSEIRCWDDVPKKNRGPYTCYCDLAHGTGQAFAVACFLDKSGQQVCEYGTNTLDMTKFTANVIAIARWITGKRGDGDCVIDFDAIGAAQKIFVTEATRLDYGNIWTSQVQDMKARRRKIRKAGELPEYYGTCNRDSGLKNFNELMRAVMTMECVIRSELVLDDMSRCSKDHEKEGKPKFPKASLNRGHGDFVHALAGAWWRMRSFVDLESRADTDRSRSVEYKDDVWGQKTELWSAGYR